jgi:hypothetical protein
LASNSGAPVAGAVSRSSSTTRGGPVTSTRTGSNGSARSWPARGTSRVAGGTNRGAPPVVIGLRAPVATSTASMVASSNDRRAEVPVTNRTVRPSGSACGNRWLFSPGRSWVNATGAPPAAGTTSRFENHVGAKTTRPAPSQVTPRVPADVGASSIGAPPDSACFHRLASRV